jgi:hypothetical protein
MLGTKLEARLNSLRTGRQDVDREGVKRRVCGREGSGDYLQDDAWREMR